MVEIALWIGVIALLSPLAIYAGAGVMPLVALYGVALGIAIALALVGRRIHAALLSDSLAAREGIGRMLWTATFLLLAVFLVLGGVAVALVLMFRSGAPKLPF